MDQYFGVINLDNPFPVQTFMQGRFGECVWEMDADTDVAVMHALWRFEKGYKHIMAKPLSEYTLKSGYVRPKPSQANNTLATELVDMILKEIGDLTDLVCFLLTCQRYYEIGRRHVEARLEETFFYSWAGNRLICLGDYAELDDLPEGMLTDDEIELLEGSGEFEVDSERNSGNYDDDNSVRRRLPAVRTLRPDYEINRRKVWYHKKHHSVRIYWQSLYSGVYRGLPTRVWIHDALVVSRLVEWTSLFPDRDKLHETYDSYVLRNLTTKEFICGAAIRDVWDTPDMPYLGALRFVHLLILRITWSSDPNMFVSYDGPIQIHRGVWAGHRFDFTGFEAVQSAEGGPIDGWKDVSKEVIKELVMVFPPQAEYLDDF